PTQIVNTLRGMRKYSTERARANELGGTMHTLPVNSTNDFGSKLLGSTTAESALVKILNSGATRVSSYGYDMRVAPAFKIFTNALSAVVDPQSFAPTSSVHVTVDVCIVPPHPFEPEWEGFVTLEISNTTPLPAKIYANEGIAQVLFFTADEGDECEVSYKDKQGKYHAQRGITLPKL